MPGYIGFDISNVKLSQYDDDGFPEVQIEAMGGPKSGLVPYEHHQPHGFISRCHDPNDDGACQVLYGMEAGRGHAFVQSDPRIIPLLPQLQKGGFCAYGGKLKAPAYFHIDGDTNSQTFYVPYSIGADGVPQKCLSFQLNVDHEGQECITLLHGSGAGITIVTNPDKSVSTILRNSGGDAFIELNDKGIIINGSLTVQGGFNAGGPSGAQPLVLAPPLMAILQQLIQIVASITSSTPGAPAAALMAQVAGLAALNTKGL